ncbi:MAG: glycosyltransferase family 39 protein [Patescibacteria group bacterium]
MTETTIPNNQRKSADLSAPPMAGPRPSFSITERWQASTYHDGTRPSLFFRLAAGLAILGWLLATGWIVITANTVGSPDEAANAYFMSVLAKTGQYRVDTGLPAEVVSFLHPRSMAVQGQFLASGSFLGLVQAGGLVIKLVGAGAERFLTPLLSLGGLLAMYFVFRRFWGRWWALLGAALIAFHPAFFEFATLPYLHNGAFVAVLMVAAWAMLRLLERPSYLYSAGFGLAYGAALFFRPIEALWTAPAVIILLLARKLWRELLVVGLITLAVQAPWLIANRAVFGSFLSSGYTPSGVFIDAVGGTTVIAPAQRLFTPAGGQWSWHWLSSAWWYFVLLVPAWSAMALVALGRYFRRKYVTRSKALKLTGLSLIGLFPLVYYGTWNLYPQTPAADVGALSSYARYWLPLYVAMAPGVIITLRLLSRRWLVISLAVILGASQIVAVWSHPVSGISARFSADDKNRGLRGTVLAATENNAVIIAGHDDKYFQDQRLSTFRLPQNDGEWKTLRQLLTLRPVYLYVAVGAVNTGQAQTTMADYGLRMERKLTIGRDALWKISLSS